MSMKKMNERKRTFLLMTIPVVALFFCFNTLPLLKGVMYSFTNFKGFGSYDWVGVRNYMDLFQDVRVGNSYWFTFKLAIVTTIVVNVISLLLAMALNSKIRAKSFFRGAYFLPNILGALVVGYIFNYFFTYILPAVGEMIGWETLSSSLLSSKNLAWIAIVIVCAWQAIAMNTIIYISGLQTVPEDVYEAGAIDGATGWNKFKNLTFPLILPFFTINMVLCVKNFLMVFDQIMALTKGGPAQSTESISYLIYQNGMAGGPFGFQPSECQCGYFLPCDRCNFSDADDSIREKGGAVMIGANTKTNKPAMIFLVLGLITIAFPLYLTVVIAFKQPSEMTNSISGILSLPSSWSLENFREAMRVTDFWNSLGNSLFITLVTVALSIVIHSMIGYAIGRNKAHSKGYNLVYLYIVSGMFVPFAILMMPLVKQTAQMGLNNRFGVILLYVVFYMPMNVLLYTGYLKNIPIALEEAACVDGASTWTTYWKIVFPIMRPMHATVAVLTALGTWNDVMTPLVIMSGGEQNTLPLAQLTFQTQFGTNYNLAFASYLLALLPILIFYLICQKQILNGVVNGAVK